MKLHTPSALLGAILVSILGLITAFATPQMTIQPVPCGLTQAQLDVLNTLSVVYIDDCQGGPGYKTLRVDGANLQVVNGLGATFVTNGLGNLIVGYNEQSPQCDLAGSHNVVLGMANQYSQNSFAGLIGGQDNMLLGEYNTVLGRFNTANDPNSAVFGGVFNDALQGGTIINGDGNLANGYNTTIVGGQFNITTGSNAVVGGGLSRSATGAHDFVAGSIFEDN